MLARPRAIFAAPTPTGTSSLAVKGVLAVATDALEKEASAATREGQTRILLPRAPHAPTNLCNAPTRMVNLSCVARAARAAATFVWPLETRAARGLATASRVVLGMDAVAILAWLLEASAATGWACPTLSRRTPSVPVQDRLFARTHRAMSSCARQTTLVVVAPVSLQAASAARTSRVTFSLVVKGRGAAPMSALQPLSGRSRLFDRARLLRIQQRCWRDGLPIRSDFSAGKGGGARFARRV